ncbi:MAG TPA: DALR domain-containing protein [Polyangiaceae bacterium]|nr:DALR domain-containing protein [Polyangiaceae bacterium]
MLHLYDTSYREKRAFAATHAPKVTIYSCGPTVYARQHLGNLRPYVFADSLCRTLELFGYEPRQVINVTDVGHLTDDADEGDDKLEVSARLARRSAWDIAHEYTTLFQRDLELVGVRSPAVWAFATRHIDEQVELVQRLEARGYTYRTGDGIYFDTARARDRGKLTGLTGCDLRPQARVVGGSEKRQPSDFALWKFSPAEARRQMEWPSPWGTGFPGWHTECAAMATKHLGIPIDIHTGGVDHIPVHHENEILQAEAAYGTTPWVKTWMHSEWVMLDGAKLAKRDGGAPNLDDVVARGHDPGAYRLLLLGAHYRTKLHFRWQSVAAAARALTRLRYRVRLWGSAPPPDSGADLPAFRDFKSALANDLDTPKALSILFRLVDAADLAAVSKAQSVLAMAAVLGLDLYRTPLDDSAVVLGNSARATPAFREAQELARARELARSSHAWEQADALRRRILELGYQVEDCASGTRLVAFAQRGLEPRASGGDGGDGG